MKDPIITVAELTKQFGSFTAVDRVSFEVDRGEIFGYLGANGAGKSTTIRMLCGLLTPTSGSATVAGVDVVDNVEAVKFSIGYMSQKFSLYLDLTVEENLQFFAGAYRLSGKRRARRIDAALEMANLASRRRVLTKTLPGGIRQRLALASALLHEPQVLYLDEPTAGVDPTARRGFWKVIRRLANEGTTLFVTTHHLDEAEYCRRVGLMVDGRLAALDTPSGLKQEFVPGTIYAISGGVTARVATQALAGQPGIRRVEPFGLSVHVRVDDAIADEGAFRQLLAARELAPESVERIDPSLEDVFLELVGASEAATAEKDAA